MLSRTSRAACLTGLLLLVTSLGEAAPPGPPFTPPGPPPWVPKSHKERSVPIPGTTLILFGGGFLILPWLRARKNNCLGCNWAGLPGAYTTPEDSDPNISMHELSFR